MEKQKNLDLEKDKSVRRAILYFASMVLVVTLMFIVPNIDWFVSLGTSTLLTPRAVLAEIVLFLVFLGLIIGFFSP